MLFVTNRIKLKDTSCFHLLFLRLGRNWSWGFEHSAAKDMFHVIITLYAYFVSKYLLTCGANWTKFAENRQTHRADVADVDQLSMTETRCTVIDFDRWWKNQLTPSEWFWQKDPLK